MNKSHHQIGKFSRQLCKQAIFHFHELIYILKRVSKSWIPLKLWIHRLTLVFLRMIFNVVCYQQNPFKTHAPSATFPNAKELLILADSAASACFTLLNTSCMIMSKNSRKILHNNKAGTKWAKQRSHSKQQWQHELYRLSIEQRWGRFGEKRKGPVQIVKEGGIHGKNETQEGVQVLNEKPKF